MIVVAERTKYKNIDRIINEPAYVRRRVRLINDAAATAKVKMKDDAPKKDTNDKSLFGD